MQPFCLLIAFKRTNSKSQQSFQAPGLHPRTAHHILSCISISTYTCVRALPALQGSITVFSRHLWVSALRFLTLASKATLNVIKIKPDLREAT